MTVSRRVGGSGTHAASLRVWLIALVLLVFLPAFGVIAASLLWAGLSYRDASSRNLLATANVVAHSVTSELEATARLLAEYAHIALPPGEAGPIAGRLGTHLVAPGAQPAAAGDPLRALAAESAARGRFAVSNLLREEGGSPKLAMAVPRSPSQQGTAVTTLLVSPTLLIQSLRFGRENRNGVAPTVVMAVTDGTGRVIARSIDGETFLGRMVPDWAALQAVGQPEGVFEARTLEGPSVIFGFQRIEGTPGWVAVVGEPYSAFQDRWVRPLLTMVVASGLTILAALALALLFAGRIRRPLAELTRHATLVAAGEAPLRRSNAVMGRLAVTEFEALQESLDEAETALRRSAEIERNAARSLAESEQRYRTIAGIGAVGFWSLGSTAEVDAGMARPGGERGEIHPEDRPRVDAAWAAARASLAPLDVEFRHRAEATGPWRWLRSRGAPLAMESGASGQWVGVAEDVTARRAIEQALQQSYDSLRRAERLARIGSWTLDLEGGHFSCSDMMYEINGWDPSGPPLTRNDLARLVSPESVARMRAAVERCISQGTPYAVMVEHLVPGGEGHFPAEVRGQAMRDASGRIIGLSGTVQDVTERMELEDRLAVLADNLPSGALYRLETAPVGPARLTYISAGILRLIGVPAEEIMADRQAFLDVIDPRDRPGFDEANAASSRDGSIFDHEFRVRTRDGRNIWMHCRSRPRRMAGGVTTWDGIMRDITAEKETAAMLRQAKEEAERAERAKSDFLAAMSHEIRTPMNTVIGMTRLVLQTELLPKQRNYLEKVNGAARTLLGIINDILDFSKIEAGGMELEDTSFTLESMLDSVSAVTALRAEEKGLEIAYVVASDVPRALRGDPLRIGQVLTNLVSNAVKFTEKGEVVVSVETAPPRDGRRMLRFAVRDTGIGLSGEQIRGLFQPFVQAGIDTARRFGGTGLGLAICRRLVGMMGGEIRVESEPGRGSTFFFTVSVGEAEETARRIERRHPQGLQGRRALIVDDNASAREILLGMVRDFGMEAEGLASGLDCVPALTAAAAVGRPYDIVLMDWRMPVMDGIETARRVRSETQLEQMPALLMVTAFGRDEVLRDVEQLNLQGLLIKPITESTLFNTVSEILDQRDPERPAPASARRDSPDGTGPHIAALQGRRVLVVDDNELNREVASEFLLAAGMQVATAVDGIDALDRLEQQSFDVVLMDVRMPRMDGFEAVRAIRRDPHLAGLPVIALTAQARREDRDASIDAGMTAHLSKPIDDAELYRTLASVIGGPSGSSSAGARAAPQAVSEGPFRFDIATFTHRAAQGRPARARQLLMGFLRDFGDGPQRAAGLLAACDLEALGSLAHTVKGCAGYLQAEALSRTAERLETAGHLGDLTLATATVPSFGEQLGELLSAVREELQAQAEEARAEADLSMVERMIADALPLVARGSFSAQGWLDRIVAALPPGERHLAEQARTLFDDLELEQAGTVLQALRARLAETRRVDGPAM